MPNSENQRMVSPTSLKNIASTSPITIQQIEKYLQDATGLTTAQIERLLLAARISITDNLAKTREALEKKEYTTMGEAAHTLKGTLLQCGLPELAAKAKTIEHGGKNHSTLPYAQFLDSLQKDLVELVLKKKAKEHTDRA